MISETAKEDTPFCSIVIPCYNEAANLPALLGAFAGALKSADIELVVVDNGSSDGTGEILRRESARLPFLRAVSCPVNLGYGGGILAGLAAARGRLAGWAHGDLQYAPADIVAAAESLRPGRAKVFFKGLRANRSAADIFFTAGMGLFASLALRLPLRDVNAQPTFFSRELFEGWTDPPRDFSLDLYAYADALRRGYAVLRRPVPLDRRLHGSSSWNRGLSDRLKLSLRMAGAVLRIRGKLGAGGRANA